MLTNRLKQLVELYPQSSAQTNVKRLCQNVGRELEQCGMAVTHIDYNGVHSLYASTTGKKHCRLLLQAHIDVVPGQGQPFKQQGDKIYGRGTYDMLYAAACFVELMKELKPQLSQFDIGIMLSGDEELGGYNGVAQMLKDGYRADICILPDAGEGFGSLNIGAKGVYTLELTVNGQAHHGSRPWEGDGAAGKLVEFLNEAKELFDTSSKDNSTMTISRLNAGDSENKGPASADCTLDIRYTSQTDFKRIQQGLQKLFGQYNVSIRGAKNGSDYKLDLENVYVKRFLDIYREACGRDIRLTRAHGSSDARFFSEYNIPVIMLRPDGGGAHGDKEWLSRQSMFEFYNLLKTYVLDVSVVE